MLLEFTEILDIYISSVGMAFIASMLIGVSVWSVFLVISFFKHVIEDALD